MTLTEIQQLEGLALRKAYWEARGWKLEHRPDMGSPIMCVIIKPDSSEIWRGDYQSALLRLDPIELSADISERELMEVCRERDYEWGTGILNDKYYCCVRPKTKMHSSRLGPAVIETFGSTPSLVRARAALALLLLIPGA